MTWDWKKAIGADGDSAGSVLTRSSQASGVAAGGKEQAHPPDVRRASSISWRPAGLACGTADGQIELVNEADHDCPFCRGRGEVPGGGVCPVCNGRKIVRVNPPSVRCAFCAGMGHMPPRSNLTCWVCKGKGLVAVRPPVTACPDCLGRGKRPCESLYCPRCRGVGVVPAGEWDGKARRR